MKKWITFLLLLVGLLTSAVGQTPKIALSPATVTENIGVGATKTVTLKIENTGSRDLEWDFNGASVYFVKLDYSNYANPANQDRIDDNVWLTRADQKGIFNIYEENEYDNDDYLSPLGTEWAWGSLMDNSIKYWDTWGEAIDYDPLDVIGNTITMHTLVNDQYYDFKFETWTSEAMGGGMSYKRYRVYPWLKPQDLSGTVAPGGFHNLDINLAVNDMAVGTYEAKMYVYSNDATNQQIEIPFTITISDAPYLSVVADQVNFGVKSIGGTYTYPLIVENKGSLPLSITGFNLSDAAFSVLESNLTVPAKSKDTVHVKFSPVLIQAYSGTLTINSNSFGIPALVLPLTGEGAGAPNISVSPLSISETIVAGDIDTTTITIENTGAYDLIWSGMVKSQIKSKVTFTKAAYADPNLRANQDSISPNVSITRGYNQGIYNIARETNYDRSSWPWISPKGTKWAWGNSSDLTPDKYDIWRNVIRSEGTTYQMVGKPLSVYLEEDNRYIDLTFNSWSSGNSGGGFSYTRDSYTPSLPVNNNTIASGNNMVIDLVMDATTLVAGVYQATIEISSNDPDLQVIQIPFTLTVTGTPAIAASDVNFGTIFTNDSKTIDLEVSNPGTADLDISSFVSSTTDFTVTTQVLTVKAKEKVMIPVTFTPSTTGALSGTLTINSNDAGSPLLLNLSGEGALASVADISPDTLEITVDAGNAATGTVTIGNTGVSDLIWDLNINPVKTGGTFTFTKADNADWLLPENQDKITDSIIITRANKQGIFNIAMETGYDRNDGRKAPKNTLWAYNFTNKSQSGDYTTWNNAIRSHISMRDLPGKPLSMYLQDEDKHIDLVFNSWTDQNDGGGFSYTRDNQPFRWWHGLSADAYSGSVAGSASTDVTLSADATNSVSGIHYSEIVITTNDPMHKTVIIPLKVTITGTPVIVADSLGFGLVDSNGSKTMDLLVSNTGTDTLTIASFSSDNSAFAVNSMQMVIPPKKDDFIKIVFTPGATGFVAGMLTINSNDTANPVYLVDLTGTGALAPKLVVDNDTIEKSIASGLTVDVTLTLENSGEVTLEGTSAAANSAPVHFTKAAFTDWTLAVNQDRITDHVWLTRANLKGIFNIKEEAGYDWDDDDSPVGTMWAWGKTIENSPGNYYYWNDAINVSPYETPYTMSMMDMAENRYFDITWESWSKGDGNYGASGGGFSYTRIEVPFWINNLTDFGTIDGGMSKDITFTLDATNLTAGVYNTVLYINSNDPASPIVEIPVQFTVNGAPAIDVPASIDFANQAIGGSKTLTLDINNTGDSLLVISAITKTKAEYTIDATFPLYINPGKSVSIPVNFTPTDAVQFDDVFTVSSNDTSALTIDINVTGTGIGAPVVEVTGNPIKVEVVTGSDGLAQLVIKNTGTTDLDYTIAGQTVTFEKANYADFTLPENQDRISDKVWITRKNSQSLFNIKQEAGYVATSPAGTLWALGLTENANVDDYKTWLITTNGNPSGLIGVQASLYLVDENRYFDFMLNSFSGGNTGGGFAYTRTEILPDWISLGSESGTITAASESTIDVNLLESGLDGTYTTVLEIATNDPLNPIITVPVTFTVSALLVENPVEDVRVEQGFVSHEIEVDSVFSAGATSITAVSSNTDIVTVEVLADTLLVITEVGAGNALITVLGENSNGKVAYDDFNFIVNAGPAVSGTIDDIVKPEGFGSYDVDLTGLFTDVNHDSITLEVSSDETGVVTVSLTDHTLTITEVGYGMATITVTASDGYAPIPTNYSFAFTVNALPIVDNSLVDVTVNEGFASKTIDLTNVFADADMDVLVYTVASSDENVVTTAISSNDLIVSEVGSGMAIITVTAKDDKGGMVSDEFIFSVNLIPTVSNGIADVLVNEGFTMQTIDLTNVFADSDMDDLVYMVTSFDENVVKTSVSSTILTITENGTGTSTITVTADDSKGGITIDEFTFTVNAIPTVSSGIVDVLVNQGFATQTINLSAVFADSDGDALSYTVENSLTSVVTTVVTGSNLVITEAGTGVSTLTLTANDGKGGSVSDVFTITVNAIPTVSSGIVDVLVNQGFATQTINLSAVFADNDGDALSYTVENSLSSVVTAVVTGSNLVITEAGTGLTTITLTAIDGKGGSVSDVFTFTVNAIPLVSNPIADVIVDEGFSTKTISLTNTFTDADGDVLTYTAESSLPSVVTVSVLNSDLTITEVGLGVSVITVSANDGKGGSMDNVFTVTVNKLIGIEDGTNYSIAMYPNPTTGELFITSNTNFMVNSTIQVVSLLGQEVMKQKITDEIDLIKLDLSSLKKGMYLVQIVNEDKIISRTNVVLE